MTVVDPESAFRVDPTLWRSKARITPYKEDISRGAPCSPSWREALSSPLSREARCVCSGTVEERSARLVARTFLGGGAARERGPLLLELDAPEIVAKSLPGQFLLVTCGEGSDPFLLRPLAVAGVRGEVLSLLVQVRGEGTRRLAALAPGSVLRLRGPLGTPFTTPKEAERLLCIAGVWVRHRFFFWRTMGRFRASGGSRCLLGGTGPSLCFENRFLEGDGPLR